MKRNQKKSSIFYETPTQPSSLLLNYSLWTSSITAPPFRGPKEFRLKKFKLECNEGS